MSCDQKVSASVLFPQKKRVAVTVHVVIVGVVALVICFCLIDHLFVVFVVACSFLCFFSIVMVWAVFCLFVCLFLKYGLSLSLSL